MVVSSATITSLNGLFVGFGLSLPEGVVDASPTSPNTSNCNATTFPIMVSGDLSYIHILIVCVLTLGAVFPSV